MTTPSTQLVLARSLTAAGISVIPIGRNKQPAVAWKEFQTRIATDDELQAWYGRQDQHGIGIVCGAVSGNLEVLDFDVRHRPDLAEVINEFRLNVLSDLKEYELSEDAPGILDRMTLIETPGPGAQLVYRCDSPIGGNQKLAAHNGTIDAETGLPNGGPGFFIESRGEGGYVLHCGSPSFCHPKGGTYRHHQGPSVADLQPITAEQRDVLWMNARWLGQEGVPHDSPQAMALALRQTTSLRPQTYNPPSTYVAPDSSGSVGDDFSNRTSWAEILTPHGFEFVAKVGEEEQWRRPGTSNPLSLTTNHNGSGLLYAFSPNCGHGIDAGRGYNKFAIHALLNHNGDFRAAASELADKGFGERRDLSHIDIDGALSTETSATAGVDPFGFESLEEFMSVDDKTEYLCDEILAAGQPCVLAGPEKSLKTGTAIDLCYSLATGTPFLGRFHCKRPVAVGVMTGESSREKLQRLIQSRSALDAALGIEASNARLFLTHSLPILSDDESLSRMETSIRLHGLEVLVIDPAYLCLGALAEKTANVAMMGNMLRKVQDVGRATGCTLIILHHTNRNHEPGKPVNLRNMSGAGWAEWARQWILVCPRKDFDPDTHQHSLWMVAGGSAGHAGRYAVDVREKNDAGEWAWITEVRSEGQEKAQYNEAKESRQEQTKRDKAAEFSRNLTAALKAGLENGGSTINELKAWFTAAGFEGVTKIRTATLEDFEVNGFASRGEKTLSNNKPVQVWLPAESA